MKRLRSFRARSKLGLAPRLTGLIVLVAIASGGLAGIVLTNTSHNALREEIFRNNLAHADLAAQFTANYVMAVEDGVRSFASEPDLIQAVLADSPEQVQSDLDHLLQTQPALDGVSLYDANGFQRVNGSANKQTIGTSFADRDWFQGAVSTRQPFFGIPVLSRITGHPIAPYAIPILNEQGQVRGILTAGISLGTLSDAILETSGFSGSRASLVDLRNGGLILAHPDATRVLTPVTGKNEAARRLLASVRGAMETPSSAGELDLAVYSPVPGLPWGILIAQPSGTAFAPIATLSRQALLITGLSILLSVLLGAWWTLRVTRPVVRLRNAARQLAAGNLACPVGFTQHDEIGDLGRAFDEMAGALSEKETQLRTWAEKLEQSVLDLQNEIAERAHAEAELERQRNLLRTVIDNLPDQIFAKDAAGRFILNSAGHAAYVGATPETMLGKTDEDYYTPELAAQHRAGDDLVIQSAQAIPDYEAVSIDKFGKVHWVLTTKVPLQDTQGHCIGIVGIARDTTESKRVREELAEQHRLLRILIDNLPDSIYVKDTDSRMLIANTAQARLLGAKTTADLLGKTELDYLPKEFALKHLTDEQAILKSGQPLLDAVEPGIDAAGDPRWFSSTKVPFRDSQGKVKGIVGISRDITERMRVEEELFKFRLGIERADDVIFMTKMDGTIVFVNPAFEKTYGYCKEEALGHTPRILKSGTLNPEAYQHFWNALLNKQVVSVELINRTKDGRLLAIEGSATPILDQAGSPLGFLAVQRDVTQRKQAEEQLLRELDKLNALHDIDRALSMTLDLQACLSIIVDRTHSLFATSSVSLMLREGERLRMVAHSGMANEELEFVIPLTRGLTGWCYSQNASVLVPDVQADERYMQYDVRARAEMAAPLLVQEQCIGVLNVESDRIGAFTPADLELLESLAGRAAIAIHNARLLKAEREQRQFSETLRDFGLALTSQHDPDTLLDELLDLVARVVPYDSAAVVTVESGILRYKRQRGYDRFGAADRVKQLEIPLENLKNMQKMAVTRAPNVVPDTSRDQSWVAVDGLHYVRSWVGAPIQARGNVLGFLSLDKAEPGYYTVEMAGRLAAFAIQAGLALENARLYAAQRNLATTDGLTGLFNRRHFMELAEREYQSARRHATALSVLMIDVDHFKQVNDQYGHAAGDRALQVVAKGMASTVRAIDVVARYGGDEFVALLPGCGNADARLIAGRLEDRVEAMKVTTDKGELQLSLSMGVAVLTSDEDLDSLLARADSEMYRVKRELKTGAA